MREQHVACDATVVGVLFTPAVACVEIAILREPLMKYAFVSYAADLVSWVIDAGARASVSGGKNRYYN